MVGGGAAKETLCAENRWIQTEVRGPGFEACQGCVVADTGSRRGQERREVVDCELVPFGDEEEKEQRWIEGEWWIRRQRNVVELKISTAKGDGGLGPSVEGEFEHA